LDGDTLGALGRGIDVAAEREVRKEDALGVESPVRDSEREDLDLEWDVVTGLEGAVVWTDAAYGLTGV